MALEAEVRESLFLLIHVDAAPWCGVTLHWATSDMFALFLLGVLAIFTFGITAAIVGRGKHRWLALASGAVALLMLVAEAVLLLGAGVVAIGTSGSLAQVLIVGCLLSGVIACVLCIISGSIAIRERGRKKAG